MAGILCLRLLGLADRHDNHVLRAENSGTVPFQQVATPPGHAYSWQRAVLAAPDSIAPSKVVEIRVKGPSTPDRQDGLQMESASR